MMSQDEETQPSFRSMCAAMIQMSKYIVLVVFVYDCFCLYVSTQAQFIYQL